MAGFWPRRHASSKDLISASQGAQDALARSWLCSGSTNGVCRIPLVPLCPLRTAGQKIAGQARRLSYGGGVRWSSGPQPFELFADALAQPADRALGAAEPLADLLGRVALEAHLDDGPLVAVQLAQQPLDRLGQGHGLLGRRLTAGGVAPRLVATGLARQVAALGPVVAD